MFCPFGDWSCVSWPVIIVMVLALSILLWLGIRGLRKHYQPDTQDVGFHPSGRPYEPEDQNKEEDQGEDEGESEEDDTEQDNDDRKNVSNGQKFVYFSDEPLSPLFVVEQFDSKDGWVYGSIEVPIPPGCEPIDLRQKDDSWIEVVYKTAEGELISDESNLSGTPEKLKGWKVIWYKVRTKKNSS